MSIFDLSKQYTYLEIFQRPPDEIIENQLYLGSINATLDEQLMSSLGITHILSVCPESSKSDVRTHMAIHVDDVTYENILIRLPEACQFIEKAIDNGGKIYVHCMMGVSRSVTVVCAYLMKSRGMSAEDALKYVKSSEQLHLIVPGENIPLILKVENALWLDLISGFRSNWTFGKPVTMPLQCHTLYSDAWKREHDEETGFPRSSGSEPIRLADKLYIIEDLPQTARSLASLLHESSITHLLTLTPHQPISMCETTPIVARCHLTLEDSLCDDLVLKLPEAVAFIDQGLKDNADAVILMHSFDLTRTCVVACAYWMAGRGLDSAAAFRLLQVGLPLYSPTTDFIAFISLFEACGCTPTPTHPEILAFRERRKEEEEDRKMQGSRKNVDTPWITWQPSNPKKGMAQETMDNTS